MIRSRWVPMVALVLTGAACAEEGPMVPGPSLAEVAGSWTAEGAFGAMVFTTTTDGSPEAVDWLARGSSLVLELRSDGTTSGRLFVPGADEDGGDLIGDLAGSWSLDDGRVTLEHEADTFVRDMVFHWSDDRLTGEEQFGDTTVRVVLSRR